MHAFEPACTHKIRRYVTLIEKYSSNKFPSLNKYICLKTIILIIKLLSIFTHFPKYSTLIDNSYCRWCFHFQIHFLLGHFFKIINFLSLSVLSSLILFKLPTLIFDYTFISKVIYPFRSLQRLNSRSFLYGCRSCKNRNCSYQRANAFDFVFNKFWPGFFSFAVKTHVSAKIWPISFKKMLFF